MKKLSQGLGPFDIENMSDAERQMVLRKVVSDPEADSATLDLLADYADHTIRIEVVRNPNTSLETLRKLADDRDIRVLVEMIKRHNLDPQLKQYVTDRVHGSVRTYLNKVQEQPLSQRLKNFDFSIKVYNTVEELPPNLQELLRGLVDTSTLASISSIVFVPTSVQIPSHLQNTIDASVTNGDIYHANTSTGTFYIFE